MADAAYKATLAKYNGDADTRMNKAFTIFSGGAGLVAGGFSAAGGQNMATVIASAAVVAVGTGITFPYMLELGQPQTSVNNAGQVIRGKSDARRALAGMESLLQKSFAIASEDNTPALRHRFHEVAAQVMQDAAVIRPRVQIVNGGVNGFGTKDLAFIVATRRPEPGVRQLVTLADGLAAMGKVSP